MKDNTKSVDNSTRPNVIIFVVDSARHYSTGGADDRDKLDIMESLDDELVYFSTAVASAPSSVMSCASMLTGLPAYYIARNYEHYKYDNEEFFSIQRYLGEIGYEIRSNFVAREMREKYGHILPLIDPRYHPEGLSENNHIPDVGYAWSNNTLSSILEKYLVQRNRDMPLFLLNWYNIRMDPTTSEEVERGINILKSNGYWENSIFLLLSDHGYIDPVRGYTPEKLKSQGLTHDLILTDDNIRIPFYLKYPGYKPQKIDSMVSTYDILPTIVELVDSEGMIESHDQSMFGTSLLRTLDKSNHMENRYIRSDGRFFAQTNRCTSIRSDKYKYIVRPDSGEEEFYDLEKDPMEMNNVVDLEEYITPLNSHQLEYQKSEAKVMEFQYSFMRNKLLGRLTELIDLKSQVIIFENAPVNYLFQILKLVQSVSENPIDIYVSDKDNISQQLSTFGAKVNIISSNAELRSSYQLVLSFTGFDTSNLEQFTSIMSSLNSRYKLLLDPNMQEVDNSGIIAIIRHFIKVVNKRKSYYLNNPKYFVNVLIAEIKRKIGIK
jgi:hypothetical protein